MAGGSPEADAEGAVPRSPRGRRRRRRPSGRRTSPHRRHQPEVAFVAVSARVATIAFGIYPRPALRPRPRRGRGDRLARLSETPGANSRAGAPTRGRGTCPRPASRTPPPARLARVRRPARPRWPRRSPSPRRRRGWRASPAPVAQRGAHGRLHRGRRRLPRVRRRGGGARAVHAARAPARRRARGHGPSVQVGGEQRLLRSRGAPTGRSRLSKLAGERARGDRRARVGGRPAAAGVEGAARRAAWPRARLGVPGRGRLAALPGARAGRLSTRRARRWPVAWRSGEAALDDLGWAGRAGSRRGEDGWPRRARRRASRSRRERRSARGSRARRRTITCARHVAAGAHDRCARRSAARRPGRAVVAEYTRDGGGPRELAFRRRRRASARTRSTETVARLDLRDAATAPSRSALLRHRGALAAGRAARDLADARSPRAAARSSAASTPSHGRIAGARARGRLGADARASTGGRREGRPPARGGRARGPRGGRHDAPARGLRRGREYPATHRSISSTRWRDRVRRREAARATAASPESGARTRLDRTRDVLRPSVVPPGDRRSAKRAERRRRGRVDRRPRPSCAATGFDDRRASRRHRSSSGCSPIASDRVGRAAVRRTARRPRVDTSTRSSPDDSRGADPRAARPPEPALVSTGPWTTPPTT